MKHQCLGFSALIFLLISGSVAADGSLELELKQLRTLVAEMQADHERRISDLEARLAAAEDQAEQAELIAEEAQQVIEDLAYARA